MDQVRVLTNWDGQAFTPSDKAGGSLLDVTSPIDDSILARVAMSTKDDVDAAIARAEAALPGWRSLTVKARAGIMFRFHALLDKHAEELATLVTKESGKNHAEALASVAKGSETVEWACSMPQLCQGRILQVSRGVTCEDHRDPLGVVGCIVPFNFPIMVPMWTLPIALTAGNCVVMKPSEKVPLTMARVAELLLEAGLPAGVFQLVNGGREAVESLCDHPSVRAVTFVGSSPVAKAVSTRCRALNKKCVALGGAKNHLVVLNDCDAASAAHDIVSSYAGAAGQRCMAASVLVLVDHDLGHADPTGGEEPSAKKAKAGSVCDQVLDHVVQKSASLQRGTAAGEVGAIIDAASKDRIMRYINEAVERDGAEVLVDGRDWAKEKGQWVGPTVLLHKSARDAACREEIFGPVLSVVRVSSFEEALAIENENPFGNAACIYTSSGHHAQFFTSRFRAGMLGVNIGIPVPREPFSFGGLYGTLSKYGDVDITGDGAMEFFTSRRKVTTKWPASKAATVVQRGESKTNGHAEDRANFNGQM